MKYNLREMQPKHEYSDMRDKILEGIRRAVQKLIAKTAQSDGELIISQNGGIKSVKAKELLNNK